jgi:hypothetical protein
LAVFWQGFTEGFAKRVFVSDGRARVHEVDHKFLKPGLELRRTISNTFVRVSPKKQYSALPSSAGSY